jgi:hypothetical protein
MNSIQDTVGDQTIMYHNKVEAFVKTSTTECQLLLVQLVKGVIPLLYTKVADEKGHPYTK